jgi:tetratricopeptide (TPR) repeat protein
MARVAGGVRIAALAAAAWSACATPPPAKPTLPPQVIDMQVPPEAPDANGLALLPAFWDQQPLRSAYDLETGPLKGPPNFDELDGPFYSKFVRDATVVAEPREDGWRLIARLPSTAAQPTMEEANRAFAAGQLDEALAGYQQVIERDPQFAKPYFYVAEVQSRRGDLEAALSWVDRGLRLSPRDAYGYALRAEALAALGRDAPARAALAYALALDPMSPRALRLLRSLGGTRAPGIEPPVFIQPPRGKLIVARGGGHPAWQSYAICRALLTYDARIRAEFIQTPLQDRRPGTRSLEEETTCGYLVTAEYRRAHSAGVAGTPTDPDLERWSKAYDANLLREAIIYETIGSRRPEVLPRLSDDVLGRVLDYVRLFVVPQAPSSLGGA